MPDGQLSTAAVAPEPRAERCSDVVLTDAYRAHHTMVRRALRQLGVEPAALDDAVQDVFVVLHRRLCDFDPRRSLPNWLWGIARGVASDYRRAARRRSRRRGALAMATRAADPAPADFDEFARRDAARALDEFLGGLDASQCAVFVMAELEGRSGPEIAETLGVNLNTVYARLRAARRRLAAVTESPDRASQPTRAGAFFGSLWAMLGSAVPKPALAVGVGALMLGVLPLGDVDPVSSQPIAARVVVAVPAAAEAPPPPVDRRAPTHATVQVDASVPPVAAPVVSTVPAPPSRRPRSRKPADSEPILPVDPPPVATAAPEPTASIEAEYAMPLRRPWGDTIVVRPAVPRRPLPLVRDDFVSEFFAVTREI